MGSVNSRPMSRSALRYVLVAIGGILVAFAVWSRTIPLDVSLWGDEAYSARQYIAFGPERIFNTSSYLPNNHVFFSLISWVTTSVIGTSEWALRSMSVVPAVASIGVVLEWARRRFGWGIALTAAALLVTSPIHLGLSVQARGYGIGFLAAAAMLWFGTNVDETGSLGAWLGLGAAALVGIWTLPQLAFVYGGHLLAIFFVKERRRWIFVHGVVVAAGSLLFYRGLVSNIISQTSRVGSRAGSVVGPLDIVADPAVLLYGGWTRSFGRWPEWAIIGSFTVVVGLGIGFLLVRRSTVDLRHLTLPWLVMMTLLVVLGSSVLDRYISFLLVPIAVLIAIALVEGLRRIAPNQLAQMAAAAAILAFLLVGTTRTAQEWDLAWENYSDAVDVANGLGVERLVTNRAIGLVGFLWYDNDIEAVETTSDACSITGSFVLLDFPFRPEGETPACLSERASRRIVIPQRRPPSEIVVWVVGDV